MLHRRRAKEAMEKGEERSCWPGPKAGTSRKEVGVIRLRGWKRARGRWMPMPALARSGKGLCWALTMAEGVHQKGMMASRRWKIWGWLHTLRSCMTRFMRVSVLDMEEELPCRSRSWMGMLERMAE